MRLTKSPKLKITTEGKVTTLEQAGYVVKIYAESDHEFRLAYHTEAGRQRRRFATREAAIENAEHVLKQFCAGKQELAVTPPSRLEYFLLLEKSVAPVPLDEVVRYYLDKMPRNFQSKSVHDVVEELIAHRTEKSELEKKGVRHVQSLRYRLRKLSDRFRCPINSLETADMEAFLNDKDYGWGQRTRYNMQQTVADLFRFAQRKGYLETGETIMDKIEKITKPAKDPDVFTPDELKRLLETARDQDEKLLPYIAIGAFAGLRSAETCRLIWEEHVDFDEKIIRLPSEITKTQQRRTVPISKTLLTYLRRFKSKTGKVMPYQEPHRHLRPVAKAASVTWVQNGLRHSCISYGMAIKPDAPKWAEQAGHSVQMLQINYKQLVSKKDAEKWFGTTYSSLDEKPKPPVSDDTQRTVLVRGEKPGHPIKDHA